jgi:Helix-turn-helix domain
MPTAATNLKVALSSRNPTRKRGSYVPGAQQIRIRRMYASGHSMARIAREERRHPSTVAKIVKTEDQERFKQEQTEKLYGFTDKAMDRLLLELEGPRGGSLAFNLLKHLGIIPNPKQKREAPGGRQN